MKRRGRLRRLSVVAIVLTAVAALSVGAASRRDGGWIAEASKRDGAVTSLAENADSAPDNAPDSAPDDSGSGGAIADNASSDGAPDSASGDSGSGGAIADNAPGGAPAVGSGGDNVPAALRSNPAAGKKLALTFDDGPHPTLTAPILDLLAKYGAKATFFVIGRNAEAYPELVSRELAEGHEVANHTETHPDLTRLDPLPAAGEIFAAQRTVFSICGYRTRLLRPPGGAANADVLRLAARLGYKVALWSVDTRDWAHTPTERIVQTVTDGASDGDIILFHDYIAGEAHTLDALSVLLPRLCAEGYEFVTVPRLFGME